MQFIVRIIFLTLVFSIASCSRTDKAKTSTIKNPVSSESEQPAISLVQPRRSQKIKTQTEPAVLYYDFDYCKAQTDTNYYASGYDPLLEYQWYLDLANIKQAWKIDPAQGEGIEIAIVDGGVQLDHEDLAENIIKGGGVNVLVNTSNYYRNYPYPYDCEKDAHGTAVAGIIAAVGDNGRGIKGIAPKAKIWSSNLIAKSKITSEGLRRTFSNRLVHTAISSNSWTSASNRLLTKTDSQFFDLIEQGLVDGFYGKGISYVFAAGNSGAKGDMSTYWEVLNHRGIIVVCAVSANSHLASFSETGANLWVCAPSSSGGALEDTAQDLNLDFNPNYLHGYGLPTTDISGRGGYNNFTDYWDLRQLKGCSLDQLGITSYSPRALQFGRLGVRVSSTEDCDERGSHIDISFPWPVGATNSYNRFFGGTSASAPIISGIIALIRSAHPHLRWRDIKLILAESSYIPDHAAHESQTGALAYFDTSRYYSHHTQYGFGIIDAAEALILASDWDKPLPEEKLYSFPKGFNKYSDTPYLDVPRDTGISFIENINIVLDRNNYKEVNQLSIKLISPNKVQSVLTRPSKCPTLKFGNGEYYDDCEDLKYGFTFASAAHLGESPTGTWHLEVKDGDIPIRDFRWKLVFYGH